MARPAITKWQDSRPRIYLRETRLGYAWSHGPNGVPTHHDTFSDCAADVHRDIGPQDFIIFVEVAK
jgi:hypothetical protein